MPQAQTTAQPPPYQPPPPRQYTFGDFLPIIGPAVLVLALVFFLNSGSKTVIPEGMPNARFATKKEIKLGNIKAKRQIAKRELTKTAFELSKKSKITFADCNPGGVIVGKSGLGKSANIMINLIMSAIRQKHTIFVTDIEGELIRATAAFAQANGYQVYVLAPGVLEENELGQLKQFGGSFNFLDVMRDENDKAKAQEISRGLNVQGEGDMQKRHAYFGPQSDALLETLLMLAKGSIYPDMLMVWALMTLPDLAERLDAAEKSGKLGKDSFFAKQSSAGIRAVADQGGGGGGDSPSASIQSSAFNMFSKFIDPEIAKAFLPSTIPLEHSGKSIVFGRIDRTQLTATSPLVGTAFHLWLNYNLDPQRKRDRNFTLISDEANFFVFRDLAALAKLARKKGGTFWLGYQQNSAMDDAYGKPNWKGIYSNLKNKIWFNSGEHDYHKIVSESLGKKTIVTTTASNSHGSSNSSNSTSDQFKELPLVPASKLDEIELPGYCVIKSASYPHPVSFLDNPIPYDPNSPELKLKEQCEKAWDEHLLPALHEEHAKNMTKSVNKETGEVKELTIQEEIEMRELIANSMLPHPTVLAARKKAAELEAKQQAKEAAKVKGGETPTDKPQAVFTSF